MLHVEHEMRTATPVCNSRSPVGTPVELSQSRLSPRDRYSSPDEEIGDQSVFSPITTPSRPLTGMSLQTDRAFSPVHDLGFGQSGDALLQHRGIPATPPPGYANRAWGSASPRSSPGDLQNDQTPTQRYQVDSPARASLLRLSASSATPLPQSCRDGHAPATPPPTYPSPPEYRNPPADAFSTSDGSFLLQPIAGDDLSTIPAPWGSAAVDAMDSRYFERNQDEVAESIELAPAYRDDVGFLSGVRRTRHIACFLATTSLFTLIALYFTGVSSWLSDEPRNFQVVIFVAYAIYAIESFGCSTASLLWGIRTAPEAHSYFHKMMDSPPHVRWTIRCFHLDGSETPDQAKPAEQRVTYSKSMLYYLHGCADDTPLRFFTSHRLCLYTFKKTRRWRDDAAEARYEEMKADFIREHSKDDFHELKETWGLEGFEDEFIACRPGQRPPAWAKWRWFMLCTLLGLSFFYRVHFASRVGTQQVTFQKILW